LHAPADGPGMHLSEATWTEVADADTRLALLPVGSTEQHGPHAPLGTDATSATEIAERGAAAHDDEVVVAPTIPVGVAEEHRAFAGTLWASEDTVRSYVTEIVESLAHHGFDRVVVVNGHGGNVDALREACAGLTRADDGVYAVTYTWFDTVDGDLLDGLGHGGPVETSVVRAVDEDLIREEKLDEAAAGAADGWGEWVVGVNVAYDSDEFTESGTVGDPRDGSRERGEAVLDDAAAKLSTLLSYVAGR